MCKLNYIRQGQYKSDVCAIAVQLEREWCSSGTVLLHETGRECCASVSGQPSTPVKASERSSPTHGHPAVETGIRDRQVRLQKASNIAETVKLSMGDAVPKL